LSEAAVGPLLRENRFGEFAQIRDNLRTNPGGLTVAWAEENSRDAIFSALRREDEGKKIRWTDGVDAVYTLLKCRLT
jgi:hypothetical protein